MSATIALDAAPPQAAVELQEEEPKVVKNEQEGTEETEQDTTDVSDEDTVIAQEIAAEAPPSGEDVRSHAERGSERDAQVRSEAAGRVRQTAALPPGLRERLALVVERGGQVGGEGQTLVSLDEAIRAVAESLPNSLRIGGSDVSRPEHPGGESFFSGRTASEMTDQQAEEIARGQLARSGLLRGQRTRVAQD